MSHTSLKVQHWYMDSLIGQHKCMHSCLVCPLIAPCLLCGDTQQLPALYLVTYAS